MKIYPTQEPLKSKTPFPYFTLNQNPKLSKEKESQHPTKTITQKMQENK